MDFFEAIKARRSIRKFSEKTVPAEVMKKSFEAALLAPNSSNTQTWNFIWVKTPDNKNKLIEGCLSQSAARTAAELVVVTADPALWRRSQSYLIEYVKSTTAPKQVLMYYEKIIPITYRWGFLNTLAPIKWLIANGVGLFRPMPRGPNSRRDLQEVAIKSAALAAENFVLALAAQGYATCMMEGFDECRLHSLLKLKSSERVVMVIAIGEAAENGTWGPQFRIPSNLIIKEV